MYAYAKMSVDGDAYDAKERVHCNVCTLHKRMLCGVIARSDSDKVEWRIRLANKWWQNYQVISSDNPHRNRLRLLHFLWTDDHFAIDVCVRAMCRRVAAHSESTCGIFICIHNDMPSILIYRVSCLAGKLEGLVGWLVLLLSLLLLLLAG